LKCRLTIIDLMKLSAQNERLEDAQTILITCCEKNGLPPSSELLRLEPIAFLTIPGAQLTTEEDSSDALESLSKVLDEAPQVEHIVLCLHSGCAHLRLPECYDFLIKRGRNAIFPMHEVLKEQVAFIKSALKGRSNRRGKSPAVHGWLYEPEIDWISFLDDETGLLLPMSANPEMAV
jgi:hypothetical protein